MKMLVSGAGGLIGSEIERKARANGHEVIRMVRRPPEDEDREAYWNIETGEVEGPLVETFDAVIHLAGEPLDEPWNPMKKKEIRSSRVEATGSLATWLALREQKPSVFITASATGYYGDRGEEKVAEDSAPGALFLSEVVQEWEAAAQPARDAGIRVAHARMGIVLSRKGGALARMMPFFKAGIGGPLGNGRQFMSFASLLDVGRGYMHILDTPDLSGPVNMTTPLPVKSKDFAKAFGKALKRPAFMPIPGFALRMLYGEMADEMLLSGVRALPDKLEKSGFQFEHPTIEEALQWALKEETG